MIIFIAVFVLLMNILQVSGVEDEDVLYFEDIQSDQLIEQWDKLPLISQTRTKTDWCEVTPARGEESQIIKNIENYLDQDLGGIGGQ